MRTQTDQTTRNLFLGWDRGGGSDKVVVLNVDTGETLINKTLRIPHKLREMLTERLLAAEDLNQMKTWIRPLFDWGKKRIALYNEGSCLLDVVKTLDPLFEIAQPIEDFSDLVDTITTVYDEIRAIGVSLAVPIIHETIQDSKFPSLDGKPIPVLEERLTGLFEKKVVVIHDGISSLNAAIHCDRDSTALESAAMLVFGTSIGLGFWSFGHLHMKPFPSSISHLQIDPSGQPPCVRCEGGCLRAHYTMAKAAEDIIRLADIIARCISIVLQVHPVQRIYIGGGVMATPKLFEQIIKQLEQRLPLPPQNLVQLIDSPYMGAMGAAFYAHQKCTK